jgi:hypothetical protein
MSKKLKFLIIFLCVSLIAGIAMYLNFNEATNFEAEGIVVDAQWNTSNHDMSLFLIRGKNSTKKLHSFRVVLQPEQIKIGDSFMKKSGSKTCLINGIEIKCIK